MNVRLRIPALAVLPFASVIAGVPLESEQSVEKALGSRRIVPYSQAAFVENRGQWDAQAQFLAAVPGANVWITDQGVVYDFYRRETAEGTPSESLGTRGSSQQSSKRRGHIIRMEFVDGFPSSSRGEVVQRGVHNYILGRNASRWASNVPRFSEVRSERIYDGVEARYYFERGAPRYDLIVAPGTDAGKIRLKFSGATAISARGSTLALKTSLGEVEQRELFAYQKVDGESRQVPCSFRAQGNTVSFDLGHYDRSRPLVIDPLLWGTYLGGSGDDRIEAIAHDSAGRAVVAGETASSDFPTTVGAYDTTLSGTEAFVAKFNSDGSALEFSTFVGGGGGDYARALAIDSQDRPIIVGRTLSSDFPLSVGAFDTTILGTREGFIATLTSDGTALEVGSYVGGADYDDVLAVVVDGSDRPIIGGVTRTASDFATLGAAQTAFGGLYDAFLMKVAADGTSVVWCTYLGGTGDDGIRSLARDSSGKIYSTGYTNSTDFPTTPGAFDSGQAAYEAFVSRFSDDGTTLEASTLLGGGLNETGYGIAIDSQDRPVVAGESSSSNFPTTLGAFDTTDNGAYDVFVAKMAADLQSIVMGTHIGGDLSDKALALDLDNADNIIVVGQTSSGADFPTTAGAFDNTFGGNSDVFVCKLSADGSTLNYSTFLGEAGNEQANGVLVDANGHAWVAGSTNSTFPTTVGAFDTSASGGVFDGFVCRIATAPIVTSISFPSPKVVGGFVAQLNIQLSQTASQTLLIALSSTRPGKFLASPTTKIRAGNSQKNLGIRTETVTADETITVMATLNGVTASTSLMLVRGGLLSLKLTGNSMSQLTSGSGTANLSGPAQQDRTVQLSSSNVAVLDPGTSVIVPKNAISANFTTNAGAVETATNVTIFGKLGAMTKTDTMTVNP